MTSYLCAFEAVNLDNLFSDCHDLSTTRGGGLSVLNIGNAVAQALKVEPISSSASQGLLAIDGESAEDVEHRVRQVLAGLPLLDHATVMVAACEAGNGSDGKFPERLASLKTRMRWDQMRSPSVVYPRLDAKRVCDIDGVRPASHREPTLYEQGKEYQSSFTHARRQFGRDQKEALLSEILGFRTGDFGVVSDLNELAEAPNSSIGNAAGKIAVLRFDGNSFGAKVEACATAAELKAFSDARIAEQKQFIRSLMEPEVSDWMTPKNKIRLEIVVYGGDEVTIVTPAWLGWRALRKFYSQGLDPGISYSGGVVFCHSNAPIHSVKKLASDLTDKAKDLAAARNGEKGNFAAYQTLESFDAIGRNLDGWMAERYPASAGGVNGAILGLDEIGILDDNMSYWKTAISKRKLHELAGALARGDLSWFDEGLPSALNKLLESKGGNTARLSGEIGVLHRALGNAVFLHILELWDYVGIV